MWYFYILQSQRVNNWFYKGSTNNLSRRIRLHNLGKVRSTKYYRPLRLVYYEAYLTEDAARLRESSIKKSGAVWGALMGRVKKGL
ncbi:MAG: GIY-YIG nuclease family protein [Candidatus Komeilibacteria bacterium]